mgnify:FL=1|jgi:hypothetical protein
MSSPSDSGDLERQRYLEEVFARMNADPQEEARIREKARALLALTRQRSLAGPEFLARWDDLVEIPVDALRARLLADTPEARELRHAHLFAGALSARDMNSLRQSVASDDPESEIHD